MMLPGLSGAPARGVECISQLGGCPMRRLFVALRVWKVSFSPPVWPTSGQTERLGARMKQHCFSHRFSLFIGLVSLLIYVVTLTAPTALARAAATSGVATALATPSVSSSQPTFGPRVYIFNPGMPQSAIQATVDAVANQQVSNYTTVAGLGLSPNDVVINGSIYVRNQCVSGSCTALNNFWRSLSNLTINVTTPNFGCYSGEFWAVSQAAPMRRVHISGLTTLMDYCTAPSFASGGFIADTEFDGSTVINGSQQQWLVRNSKLDGWTNGVWNQVFSGVVGAPAQCFPAQP